MDVKLTNREQEILNYLKYGLENDEIASKINVSRSTVKFHIGEILRKLGAKNRTHSIYLAYQYKLID